jgi:hypothetical protein
MICRAETDTHKIRETNKVKIEKTDTKNVCCVGCHPMVELLKEIEQNMCNKN